jgi:hypothetical protein
MSYINVSWSTGLINEWMNLTRTPYFPTAFPWLSRNCSWPSVHGAHADEVFTAPYSSNGSVSQDGAVGIGFGVVPVGARFVSCLCHLPDRPWDPPILIFNGYHGILFRGQGGWVLKLITYLQLGPRWRKHGSIHPLPILHHGIVLSQAQGQLYRQRYQNEL